MTKLQVIVFTLIATCVFVLPCCDSPIVTPPDVDPTDSTKIDTLDTTSVDTIPAYVVDTLWVDTILRDTIINLENNKVVLGYVAHYNSGMPDPNLFTHLCYAFAELYVVDNVYQKIGIKAPEARFQKILALRNENPNLKILLSINHTVENSDNKMDGGFMAMSATEEGRKKFAEDCLAFCKQYDLAGIDIDWELPGLSQSGSAIDIVNDVDNFTRLMKQLRETLGNDYLLTFAGWNKDKKAITGGWMGIDLASVAEFVDWCNIMTYGMGAPPYPHNAMSSGGEWDILRTWNAFQKAGFPADKMVLGIPWYTRNNTVKGEYTYKQIMYNLNNNPDKYQTKYNYAWRVPYVLIDGVMSGSYDDTRSISYKGNWLLEKGMRGLMCWEIASDDKNKTLSHAMWNAMKTYKDTLVAYEYHLSDSTIIHVDVPFVGK